MEIHRPTPLLGGLSPAQFMRRHWQKKPLLVRQAFPDMAAPPIERSKLFDLAGAEGVESRLIRRRDEGWALRHGPLPRRALPPRSRPGWTLLVQGVDLHDQAVHDLLGPFRFLPDARLDDVMVSYASEGGGVGPHFDSYDVFLLQVQGSRRWSIGRQRDLSLEPGVPLKILSNFEPEQSFVLAPGDMLYLPPRYAHDGVATTADCMTCSIGLRAPAATELASDLMVRMAEAAGDEISDGQAGRRYGDPRQVAVDAPARMPADLQAFARRAVERVLADPRSIDRALGESLTEPKSEVWFDPGEAADPAGGVVLDRRTRMLYDDTHLFINGESFRASGRDATLMRKLADGRRLDPSAMSSASEAARELIGEWCEAGWVHVR